MTAGWTLAYLDAAVVRHHPSPRRDFSARRRLLVRNALWTAWLRRPLTTAMRDTVRMVGARPRDRETWRGALEAFGGLAWVVRHRRRIPGYIDAMLRAVERADRHGARRTRRTRARVAAGAACVTARAAASAAARIARRTGFLARGVRALVSRVRARLALATR